MAKDKDDDYYYDAGTINEQFDDFQIYEKDGELTVHDKRTDDVFNFQSNGNFNPPSVSVKQLNNVETPDPEDGGQGIIDALNNSDVVKLKPGVYETDQQIDVGGDKYIIGEGHRGQTSIRATSNFPSSTALMTTGGNQNKPILQSFELDARGNAQDCLLVGEGDTDWVLRQLRLRHSSRDGLRLIGSFNGLIERVRIRRCNRAGIVSGDTGGFRASSIKLHKCHIDKLGESNNTYSDTSYSNTVGFLHGADTNNPFGAGYAEATKDAPNFEINNSDISGSDVGVYLGKRASEFSIFRGDVESNTTGVKFGGTSVASFLPREVTIFGMSASGNTTAVEINSGEATLISVGESGATTGLSVDANANGPVIEIGNRWDNGRSLAFDSISLDAFDGSKLPIHRADLVAQDLTSKSSDSITDYRHHDGSGSPAAGLYRGDGAGGWVKVEDNTVTI